MLVLTRKEGQDIVIPDLSITVRIVDIKGGAVRVGIEAPRNQGVYRREVWEKWNDGELRESG